MAVNISPFIPQCQDIFLHQVNNIVQPHPEGEAFANHVFLQKGRKNTIDTEAQQCSVKDQTVFVVEVPYKTLPKWSDSQSNLHMALQQQQQQQKNGKLYLMLMIDAEVNVGDTSEVNPHLIISQPVW